MAREKFAVMAKTHSKLDQALNDLIEAYSELEEELGTKHAEDEEALSHAMIEALETSIEGALEEHDYSSSNFASVLSMLTEALEQVDPAAFEDESEDYDMSEVEYSADDADIDDADLDDLDDDDADEDDADDADEEDE